MSGGSFDYLCYEDTEAEAVAHSRLRDMAERLEGLAPHHPVTLYTRALAERTDVTVPAAVKAVWKAVEWKDSCDWGDDQLTEALSTSARLSDEVPAGRSGWSPQVMTTLMATFIPPEQQVVDCGDPSAHAEHPYQTRTLPTGPVSPVKRCPGREEWKR